jgi:hypothetical protein
MPRLSRELIKHRLPIKAGFRPYKQGAQNFKPEIVGSVKEEVDRLLQARFVWTTDEPIEVRLRSNIGKVLGVYSA